MRFLKFRIYLICVLERVKRVQILCCTGYHVCMYKYTQYTHVEASDNAKHNIRHIHFLSANNACLQTV